ncbi:MAG: DUF4262 domain-containing protein [Myxococcota bacterium]
MTRSLPTPEDASDRKLLTDVANVGWHVVKVPEADGTPSWCFTVGLQHNFDHPEFVIFGLPLTIAHVLLNIGGEAVKAGRSFHTDVPYDDFLEGFSCVLRPVAVRWQQPFLGYARWFYRGAGFAALQVFWPDSHGVMPWGYTADDCIRSSQPLLYEPTVELARVARRLASMEGSA